MPAAISATPGAARIGPGPGVAGSLNLRNPSIPSPKREASSRVCKPATITCCRIASSSAPRSMHRFRAFQISPASPSAASRTSPRRRSARRATARRCSLPAPCGAASVMLPGNWLFYATGGFAWTYDQLTLTQLAERRDRYALFVAIGLGGRRRRRGPDGAALDRAARISVHRLRHQQRVVPDRGAADQFRFFAAGTARRLELSVRQRCGAVGTVPKRRPRRKPTASTFTARPRSSSKAIRRSARPMRAPIACPAAAQGRETFDATLYAGVRLWQGAELWVNPEIDQGFGLADTHGVAGFPSAEAYKLGDAYPYARVQRYFVRQTIDLGGETEKVDADINQFAGSQTANRLVLTVGKFAIVDIFDTNKYANNPEGDFLNWSVDQCRHVRLCRRRLGLHLRRRRRMVSGPLDAARRHFRPVGDPRRRRKPAGAYGLDPTFKQFQLVGEIEERHELWGQPGKLKITGFLSRGRAGSFQDAIALALATGQPADINAVRTYTSRPGVSLNLEQQVTETLGVFARAGWADGNVEPWDFTDIDRTVSGRRLDHRQTMGQAGRHDRHRRRRQRHFRRARGVSQCRRPGHSRRRRTVAESRPRADRRDLLQLRSVRLDAAHLRLSVHRQPRLQHRPRAGERFCRAVSRCILKPQIEQHGY